MKLDHTGFCLDTFDTNSCKDCPTLKECLVMYAKDKVKKVVKEMGIKEKGE